MSLSIFGAQAAVSILNRAFKNSSPANTVFQNQVNNATASLASGADSTNVLSYLSFANTFGAGYATQTPAALATLLMTNLGLLPNAELETGLADYITANGVGNIGIIALQLGTILTNLEGDTNYGAAATAWNNEVTSAFTYSSNTANTTELIGDPPPAPVNPGQNYTLTTNVDNIMGSAGNDSISGVEDGTATDTFNNLDVIDGGAGTDTLTLTNASGTMTLPTGLTVKNVENLVLRSAQNALTADVQAWTGLTTVTVDQLGTAAAIDIDTKANATSVVVAKGTTVAITDNGTGTGTGKDVLASVTLNGNTGAATIDSDALTTLSLANSGVDATVTAGAATRTLAVTIDKLTGGTIADGTATSLTVAAANNASTGITLTAGAAGTITLSGDKAISTALGAQKAALAITSTNSAGVTIGTTLNTDVTFTGGAGKDSVTVGATTKTIDMGAGDDTVTVTAALGTNGALNGGEGTDTLSMTSALANTLSGATTFAKAISNFEKVSVGAVAAATTDTVNLSNLKDINYVVSAGTGAAGVKTAEVQTFTVTGATTANVAEVQTVTVTAGPTADGTISVGGALVNVKNADTKEAVAAAIAAQAVAIKAANSKIASVVDSGLGVVTITYEATAGDVADIALNLNSVAGLAAAAAEGTKGVNSGTGNITVGGVNVAVTAGDAVDTIGAAIAAQQAAIKAADANIASVAYDAGTDTVTVTYINTAGDVAPIAVSAGTTGATFGVVGEGTKGVVTADSVLNVTNMANAGTFELTGVVAGAASVAMKDSTSSADVLNIKLNGANEIVNTGTLTVAGVETINIEATDSAADTTTLDNPSAASTINLVATAATKIVLTGNHGVNFTGSTLTNVVELDASGVVSVGDAAGASATQIGTTGAVTFTSAVTDKNVIVKTGNGADTIILSSVTDTTKGGNVNSGAGDDAITGTSGADTIDAGAGRDTITATAGADTITLGAGNDVYVLGAVTNSTLAVSDTITDFVANTKANATASKGATTTVTDLTGDTIDITAAITAAGGATTGISVFVASTAADAQTFLQNTGTAGTLTGIALDSSTGKLYMDFDSNGTVDSVIVLTGVTTITAAAFVTGIA